MERKWSTLIAVSIGTFMLLLDRSITVATLASPGMCYKMVQSRLASYCCALVLLPELPGRQRPSLAQHTVSSGYP
jgi:hypothetical protein